MLAVRNITPLISESLARVAEVIPMKRPCTEHSKFEEVVVYTLRTIWIYGDLAIYLKLKCILGIWMMKRAIAGCEIQEQLL